MEKHLSTAPSLLEKKTSQLGTSLSQYSKYPLPNYLLESYWWAYLSPVGVKIFDRPWVVNAILWGHYNKIAQDAAKAVGSREHQVVASISCAYGQFFPWLAKENHVKQLSVFDIAPIQLNSVKTKIEKKGVAEKCHFFIANAEQIPLASNHADCSVLYFLLHELPETVRANVLRESIRLVKQGGRIIIADYAPIENPHLFHNNTFFREIFEKLEPYLGNFWRCNLLEEMQTIAKQQGKKITLTNQTYYFQKFYRLVELSVQ